MESVSLYSEARNEYLKQLATWIVPPLVEFFRNQYNLIGTTAGKRAMSEFQKWCSEIPRWNQDIIDTNVTDLLESCRCDYVQELMTAVFIAHTKMLTAIRVSSKHKKLQINIPKLNHFLHRVFIECARSFWKAPFLFNEELSLIDKQKNVLQAESMCTEALSGAVRSLLPVKSILNDYLNEDDSSSSEDFGSEVEEEEEQRSSAARKRGGHSQSSSKKKRKSAAESESDEEHVPISSADNVQDFSTEPEDHGVDAAAIGPAVAAESITAVPAVAGPPITAFSVAAESITAVPAVAEPPITAVPAVAEPPITAVPAVVAAPEPAAFSLTPVTTISDIQKDEDVKELLPMPERAPPSPARAQLEIIKEPATATPQAEIQELTIDTEPSVRFSEYETVYDERTENVSHIRYAPKMSIEELDDSYNDWGHALPKIKIAAEESTLDGLDVESYDSQKSQSQSDYDDEEPLGSGDFEEV
jgi:hypothetical protein